MNRRTLLTTLLSGLSAGVAAIAGRKQLKVKNDCDGLPMLRHDSGAPIGQITQLSKDQDGLHFTVEVNDGYMHRWMYIDHPTDLDSKLQIKRSRA